MKYLLTCMLLAGIAGAAVPRTPNLPREKPLPVETVRGYIVGEFQIWGQWQHAAKVFDLVDDKVFRSRNDKLAYLDRATYLELERNDGQAVELKVLRASREANEWLVVLSVKVIE